jgi:signal transduction histidine kinase
VGQERMSQIQNADYRYPVHKGYFMEIAVSDTGIGLDEQDLERIFKPFEQVDNVYSSKYPGTGLGLSLTKIW